MKRIAIPTILTALLLLCSCVTETWEYRCQHYLYRDVCSDRLVSYTRPSWWPW